MKYKIPNVLRFHFGKRAAKIPFHFPLAQHIGSIIDGFTGLFMLPFGRYGTSFNVHFCEEALRYGMNMRKKELAEKLLINQRKDDIFRP